MQKALLRKQALAQRSALTNQQTQEINLQLLANFKKLDFNGINAIHVFLPIVRNVEPNTFLFIDWLQQAHSEIKIVVSKSNFANYTMSSHLYLGKADLIENKYQIPEPKTEVVFSEQIDMVLVPLLAFDKFGYRVGYGKGFYDRFLTDKQTIKVGVAFFEPVEQIEDVHLNDIKLDYCLTPKQIYKFAQ